MPILFLAFALVALSGPLLTQSILRSLWLREELQIAVDNAAIVLGKGDRKIWNELTQANRTLEVWEAIHDVVHSCARLAPQSPCAADDRLWEVKIDEFRQASYWRAQSLWQQTWVSARLEASRFSGNALNTTRSSTLPVVEVACPRCGRPVFWEIRAKERGYLVWGHGTMPLTLAVEVRWSGRSLRNSTGWDYFLRPAEYSESRKFP